MVWCANGVDARVTPMLPDDFVPFAADIVVANILANPLIRLAPLLASSIANDGKIALAGLLDRDELDDAVLVAGLDDRRNLTWRERGNDSTKRQVDLLERRLEDKSEVTAAGR